MEVGTIVTIKKNKQSEDGLNKFAGWESTVLSILSNATVSITHPYTLGDPNDSITVPVDRLKIVERAKPSKPTKPSTSDVNMKVVPGDKVMVKNNWFTVLKGAPANSKTIVTTTSAGKERRIWRSDIKKISTVA